MPDILSRYSKCGRRRVIFISLSAFFFSLSAGLDPLRSLVLRETFFLSPHSHSKILILSLQFSGVNLHVIKKDQTNNSGEYSFIFTPRLDTLQLFGRWLAVVLNTAQITKWCSDQKSDCVLDLTTNIGQQILDFLLSFEMRYQELFPL